MCVGGGGGGGGGGQVPQFLYLGTPMALHMIIAKAVPNLFNGSFWVRSSACSVEVGCRMPGLPEGHFW